jgi:CheY-like chemotaxis protein
MTNAIQTILVVDENPETRTMLAQQLSRCGCAVLEAADGRSAMDILRHRRIRLVVSELYLSTAESECLIQAMRQERMRGTRAVAHTLHATSSDREWAKRWGASAFVTRPATAERLEYVVTRLLARPKTRSKAGHTGIARRDTLNLALAEIERGEMHDTLAIIFGRPWWDELPETERSGYRKRARPAGVSLRTDAMMSRQFVEVRSGTRPDGQAAPTRPSPYRA